MTSTTKAPDGVRPTDGRPDVSALLKMQGRNRDYDLGNSRGRSRSAAPDAVRAGNGFMDGQPASAEILNPTDGTGDYRYRIYNDQTGATLEEGTGRDLADVKAKVDRIYSSQRGGGMARTAGNEVRYEARSVERKKDPSRGDFGRGPFYDHQVVEVRKDGSEFVKVKTSSASRAAEQAAEMNAKEGVTPKGAIERASDTLDEIEAERKPKAAAPKLSQQEQLKALAAEHGWEIGPGRFPGTVAASGTTTRVTPDAIRKAVRHRDNSGVLHRPTWDQDTYSDLQRIEFSIGPNGKLSDAFLSTGTPWTGSRPQKVSIKKALEHIQANPRRDEAEEGARIGDDTPGLRTMGALLDDLEETGDGKIEIGANRDRGSLAIHVRGVRDKLRGGELTEAEAAGKLAGISQDMHRDDRDGPVFNKLNTFARHLRYGGDGRPEDLPKPGAAAPKGAIERVSDRLDAIEAANQPTVTDRSATREFKTMNRELVKDTRTLQRERGGEATTADQAKAGDTLLVPYARSGAGLSHRERTVERVKRNGAVVTGEGETLPPDTPVVRLAAPKGAIERASDAIAEQRGLPKSDIMADDSGPARITSARENLAKTGNPAADYGKNNRATNMILARQAGISVRGKSNDQLAAELRAKDEQNRAKRAKKLNPSAVGTPSTQHATHTATPADPAIARLSDERLANALEMFGNQSVKGRQLQAEADRRKLGQVAAPSAPAAPPAGNAAVARLEKRVESLRDRRDALRERRRSTGARIQSAAESKAENALQEAEQQLREARRPKAEAVREAAPEAPKAPTTWIDKATGRVVTNPGQVGIVRGDIVKADSDAGKAAVAARDERRATYVNVLTGAPTSRGGNIVRADSKAGQEAIAAREARLAARRDANLDKARTVQREMRREEIARSTEPKDNGSKIKALENGTVDTVSLYKTAKAGPSGQRTHALVGKVEHTPDHPSGEFRIRGRDGEVTGWASRTPRNGETVYVVHSEGPNGEQRLEGWAGELATAADVLNHGEVAARGYGNRNSDSERVSKGTWEGYAGRNMPLDELELTAARDQLRRAKEHAASPDLAPIGRRSAEREVEVRQRQLDELLAERRGEQVDTSRDSRQTGGVSNAPTTEATMPNATKPRSELSYARDSLLRTAIAIIQELGPQPAYSPNDSDKTNVRAAVEWGNKARAIAEGRGTKDPWYAGAITQELYDQGYLTPAGGGGTRLKPELVHGPGVTAKGLKHAAETAPTPKGGGRTGATAAAELASRHETSKLGRDVSYDEALAVLSVGVSDDDARSLGFEHAPDRPVKAGDHVMVYTFDRWRGGIVTEVGVKNVSVAYTTPTGGRAVMRATRPNAAILRKTDGTPPPSSAGRIGPAALPKAPEPRPRLTEADRAAAKEARKAQEKADSAARRQRFFDEKIDGITAALNGGDHADNPEWHLQMTTEEGLVSLAKHLGVKVPNRTTSQFGTPQPRTREQVDAIRADIIDAVRARQAPKPAPTAAPATVSRGDSISRHVNAPVSVDIFENGAGQLDIGPANNRTVYDISRHDGKWHAERIEGPVGYNDRASAATLPDLARLLARQHGVSGTVSIQDERAGGRSLTQRFEHAARTGQAAAPAAQPGLSAPFNPRVADGGGDAPRIPGESDFAYRLRTAPSDDYALRILNGYNAAGLRAIARDEQVPVRSGASKPDLINAIMEIRRRWQDSQAIRRG